MLPAGKSLRTLREKLGLTMRDVENSSARVADKYRNEEFSIPPSRLSDIETKGILPSIFRLYTMSVIYRRDFRELMSWYGVDLNNLPGDLGLVSPPKSHVSDALNGLSSVQVPVRLDPAFDDRRTTNLGPDGRAVGTGPDQLPGAICQQRFHLRLRRHAGFHHVSHSAARQFHSGGRVEEQGGRRLLALGIRASHLFCGNARWPYLLLVQHAARGDYSATPSVISGSGSDSAAPAGSRSAGPGGGRGYEIDRVARPRCFARVDFSRLESASSTELR